MKSTQPTINLISEFKLEIILLILFGSFGLWYAEEEYSIKIEDRNNMIEYAQIVIDRMELEGANPSDIITKRKNLNNFKFDNGYHRNNKFYLAPIAYSLLAGSLFGIVIFAIRRKGGNAQLNLKLEILLLVTCVVLGVMWAGDPSGNYEPFIVLCGAIMAVLETARRTIKNPPGVSDKRLAEVTRLLKELKSIKQIEVKSGVDEDTKAVEENIAAEKLTQFLRQKSSIEEKFTAIGKLESLSKPSPAEALEIINMPDILRTAMREYLNEGLDRVSESYEYLDWALGLGKTIEELLENRLSTGVWG